MISNCAAGLVSRLPSQISSLPSLLQLSSTYMRSFMRPLQVSAMKITKTTEVLNKSLPSMWSWMTLLRYGLWVWLGLLVPRRALLLSQDCWRVQVTLLPISKMLTNMWSFSMSGNSGRGVYNDLIYEEHHIAILLQLPPCDVFRLEEEARGEKVEGAESLLQRLRLSERRIRPRF